MGRAGLWMCAWPGLPRLWRDGHGPSLASAFLFALLLNLALVATFAWPGVLSPVPLSLLWLATLMFWTVSAWNSHQWVNHSQRLSKRPGLDQLFVQAQSEYLKGHWLETETLLRQLLDQNDRDVDAHLLLATVFRRTNRRQDAICQLDLLDRLERAEKWRLEIEQERQLLKRIEENNVLVTNSKVA